MHKHIARGVCSNLVNFPAGNQKRPLKAVKLPAGYYICRHEIAHNKPRDEITFVILRRTACIRPVKRHITGTCNTKLELHATLIPVLHVSALPC